MLKGQKTGGVTTAQPPKRRNSGTTKQVLFTVSQTGMNNGGLWYKGDALNEPVGMLDIVQIWSAYNSTVHGFTSDGVMECSMRATTQRYRMITGSRDDNMTCRIIWFTSVCFVSSMFSIAFQNLIDSTSIRALYCWDLSHGTDTITVGFNRWNGHPNDPTKTDQFQQICVLISQLKVASTNEQKKINIAEI